MADNLTKVLAKCLHYQVQVLVGLGNLSTLWNIGDFYRQAFGNMRICLNKSAIQGIQNRGFHSICILQGFSQLAINRIMRVKMVIIHVLTFN